MSRFIKKRKIAMKRRNVVLAIIIMLAIFIMIAFNYINNRVTPLFLDIAESETKKFATLIINNSVSDRVSDKLDADNLYNISKDSKGNISSIDFNSVIVNKLLTAITSSIELNLKYLEEGRVDLINVPKSIFETHNKRDLNKGIIYKIPSGVVFNNTILSNIGPKVPVRLNIIGSITSNISAKITNYGINNALIELFAEIDVTLEVILPYTKKKTHIKTRIPLALKMIQGTVPSYYSGASTSPSINLPIE